MSSPQTQRKRAESFSDPFSSQNTAKLRYFFQAMDPQVLVERLSMRLHPHAVPDPASQKLLVEALRANGFAAELDKAELAAEDTEIRHCVRCHSSYLEKDNARDACVIRHAYPVVSATKEQKGTLTSPCPSCYSSISSSTSCVMTPTCFVGRHTTNPMTAYGNKSTVVQTCEQRDCLGQAKVFDTLSTPAPGPTASTSAFPNAFQTSENDSKTTVTNGTASRATKELPNRQGNAPSGSSTEKPQPQASTRNPPIPATTSPKVTPPTATSFTFASPSTTAASRA